MHGLRFLDFGLGGLLGSGFGFRVLGFGKLKVTSVLTDSTMEQRLDLATSGPGSTSRPYFCASPISYC